MTRKTTIRSPSKHRFHAYFETDLRRMELQPARCAKCGCAVRPHRNDPCRCVKLAQPEKKS
jgi:hypothetical protein